LPLPAETAGLLDELLDELLDDELLCVLLECALLDVVPEGVPEDVVPVDVVPEVVPVELAVVTLALARAAPPTAPATEMATSPVVRLVTRRRPRSRVFMESSSVWGVVLRAGGQPVASSPPRPRVPDVNLPASPPQALCRSCALPVLARRRSTPGQGRLFGRDLDGHLGAFE
jgi:hypothetical protein